MGNSRSEKRKLKRNLFHVAMAKQMAELQKKFNDLKEKLESEKKEQSPKEKE